MKQIPIRCSSCTKVTEVTAGEGHTAILKCDCGATTTIKGDPVDLMAAIQKMVPELMSKLSGRKGLESGVDEAIHEVAKEMALEILKNNPAMRDALRDTVQEGLEGAFLDEEEGPR